MKLPAPSHTALATRRAAQLILLATIVGFALRLLLLHAYPLRADEAIYSMWARAAWRDPWYLHTWPDKPPLFLWMQAAALALFGANNAGARVLSLCAGTAMIPLAGAAARRVWPAVAMPAAVSAAWLMALTPYAISFAPTAYTDTLLVFWGLLALTLGLRGRGIAAGAALGAAIMTKQQGLLYTPLLLALPFVTAPLGARLRAIARLALGMALVLLPILAWDAARWATAPSPWDLGVRNYGALRLAPLAEWPARARGWGNLLWYMGGNWAGWLALAVLTLAGARIAIRTHTRISGAAWLLAAWALGFLLLHAITTVQVWDRYLLPLAPVIAICVGGLAALGLQRMQSPRLAGAVALVALALLALPAWTAARGGFPIGADHGAYSGLDEALAWVAAQGPAKQVLYHNALGWNAQYTLYDAVQSGQVELRWFASSVALADNAARSAWLPRTLIEADWAPSPHLASDLAQRGLELVKQMRVGHMTVYSIMENAHAEAVCDWCVNRAAPWLLTAPGNTEMMSR